MAAKGCTLCLIFVTPFPTNFGTWWNSLEWWWWLNNDFPEKIKMIRNQEDIWEKDSELFFANLQSFSKSSTRLRNETITTEISHFQTVNRAAEVLTKSSLTAGVFKGNKRIPFVTFNTSFKDYCCCYWPLKVESATLSGRISLTLFYNFRQEVGNSFS